MTNPPPVAPVEGHYALLRNGSIVGPMRAKNDGEDCFDAADCEGWDWRLNGGVFTNGCHSHDIIATISPADMQAVASGDLERLRAVLSRLLAACEAKDAWSETDTTKAFDNMLYEYERAQDEARTTLQGDAP